MTTAAGELSQVSVQSLSFAAGAGVLGGQCIFDLWVFPKIGVPQNG